MPATSPAAFRFPPQERIWGRSRFICAAGLCLTLVACNGTPLPPTATAAPIEPSSLGGRIVFDNGEDIFTVDPDGSTLQQLTDRPGAEFDPMWSPDGKQIVYRDSRRGLNHDDEIYLMNADGSGQTDLSNSPSSNEWGPAWSPAGDTIAFNSDRDGPQQLYLVNRDGSEWKQLTDREAEYPSWSPDGSKIAFMSQVGATYDIYTINSDGSGLARLTDAPGEDGWPAWSPDAKAIIFESERDDCKLSTRSDCKLSGDIGPFFDIWIKQAGGSQQTRLTQIFGQFSTWSPDGNYILFNSFGGLYVMRRDGSQVTHLPINAPGGSPLFADWTK